MIHIDVSTQSNLDFLSSLTPEVIWQQAPASVKPPLSAGKVNPPYPPPPVSPFPKQSTPQVWIWMIRPLPLSPP